MKMLEMGFRNHQIPFISNGNLTGANKFSAVAKDGDMIFFLTPDYNLDFREMGILTWKDGELRVIQISPQGEKVVMEQLPLAAYVKRNIKRIQGARIIRIR